MNRATVELEPLGQGKFAVKGAMDFSTATKILEQSQKLFDSSQSLQIDLREVDHADSAGLALLIEWLSWARGNGRQIQFLNVPEQIRAIARISDVEELLEPVTAP